MPLAATGCGSQQSPMPARPPPQSQSPGGPPQGSTSMQLGGSTRRNVSHPPETPPPHTDSAAANEVLMPASETGPQPSGLNLSKLSEQPDDHYMGDFDPTDHDGHSDKDSMTARLETDEKLTEFLEIHNIPLASWHALNTWDLDRNKRGSPKVRDLGLDPKVQDDVETIRRLQVKFKTKKDALCKNMKTAFSPTDVTFQPEQRKSDTCYPLQDMLHDLQATSGYGLMVDELNTMLLNLGEEIFTEIGECVFAYPLPGDCSKGLVMYMETTSHPLPVFFRKACSAYKKGESRPDHFNVADKLVALGCMDWRGAAATKGHKPTKTAVLERGVQPDEKCREYDWANWWLKAVCGFQEHVLQY